jgi:DNA-binding transcriptional ArsR family regulator
VSKTDAVGTAERSRISIPRPLAEIAAEEARARDTTLDALIIEMLVQRFDPPPPSLAAYPALPPDYPPVTARVYAALAEAGGTAATPELADRLNRHRGNVDRHLTRLREDGYIRRYRRGVHAIVTDKEARHTQAS